MRKGFSLRISNIKDFYIYMFICTRQLNPRNKSAMASDKQLQVEKKMSTNHYMKPLSLYNEGFVLSNAELNDRQIMQRAI
jgi:hypothetical protein